jgi:hypothetical protein
MPRNTCQRTQKMCQTEIAFLAVESVTTHEGRSSDSDAKKWPPPSRHNRQEISIPKLTWAKDWP